MIRGVSFALMFVVCLATGGLARAQDQAATTLPPAHIATADGAATLERNGRGEAAVANTPLLEGDRLRTDVGRLDLLLPDGSAVELDRYTTVDLLSGGLVRLATGRLVFAVTGQSGSATVYEVDTPAGRVRLSEPGEYRVSTLEAPGTVTVNVSVVRGVALVGASVAVRDGEKVILQNGQVLTGPEPFNVEQPDAFYQWADQLRNEQAGTGADTRLPPALQTYGGTFDRNGTWDNSPDYGYVWYPTVAPDWRPYYDGSWQPYSWGWTWIGAGPGWIWPTHHYGRWGFGARGWFWIPGALWGPAWVAWSIADAFVGWCALGFGDRPVFGFGAGSGFNAWRGWTVVPSHAFGLGSRVPAVALTGARLATLDRAGFAVGRTAPAAVASAAARRWGGAAPSSAGRGQAVAARPNVAARPWTTNPASPYARAQEVAGQRVTAGTGTGRPWASASQGAQAARPSATERPWTADRASPYSRAQDVAQSRSFTARPFAAPSSSAYPERYRSTAPSAAPRGYEGYSGARPSARSYAAPRGAAPSYQGGRSSVAPRSYAPQSSSHGFSSYGSSSHGFSGRGSSGYSSSGHSFSSHSFSSRGSSGHGSSGHGSSGHGSSGGHSSGHHR
jgi:hypothetical protein